mmetsp:Transcript_13453/g.34186  ORF Transcript_13453/g.34186 Transcript_13453/m.34186 type:complete len:118 (+) Transcript_13453:198-551(+)
MMGKKGAGGAPAAKKDPKGYVEFEKGANRVVVFSKTFCPYCTKVKAKFQDMKVNANVIELDKMPEGASVQSALLEVTGQRTVPNVFIGGKHVGGCDAVLAADASGELAKMLKAAGAV